MTTSNDDILRALGRVEEGVRRLQEDFRDEKQAAHDSRAAIHSRLDEQVDRINRLDTTVAVSGQLDAQIRGEVQALKEVVETAHAPAVADWKRIKMIGLGISGLIAFTGISIGVFASWASETAVAAIRHWLKIP